MIPLKEELAIKELSKLAMYGLLIVVVLLIAFYGLASHKSMKDTLQNLYNNTNTSKVNTFVWYDVYDLNGVKTFKYEVTRISNGELDTEPASFVVEMLPNYYKIKIITYDGAVAREGEYYEYIDSVTYYCSHKQIESRNITCEHTFPDSKVEFVSNVLPSVLKKDSPMLVRPRESAVYKGEVYDALMLISLDGNIKAWLVKDIPIPVRLEIKKGDEYYIAKLINYVS